MKKSAYLYNTQYEVLLGRWGTSSEKNLLGNLFNAENGRWANEKPNAYVKRIRPELVTIISRLNHHNVSSVIRAELLMSVQTITDYQGVCTALDKISVLTSGEE